MSKARLRIPSHVFGYTLAIIPAVVYGFYYQQNKPTDEDFEAELKENYSRNIEASHSKRADMVKFMDALKKGQADKRMDEVLRAGKGEMKRHYRVDDRYYGTQEGVEAKQQMEEKLKKQRQEKKLEKTNATKNNAGVKSEDTSPASGVTGPSDTSSLETYPPPLVTAAALGTTIMLLSFIFGGEGRSR